MADIKFEEGKAFTAGSLTYIAPQGQQIEVEDATVVFTAGWASVSDVDETFVVPRDRVIAARRLKPTASSGRMIAF